MKSSKSARKRRGRMLAFAAGVASALVIAAAAEVGTGLGDRAVRAIDSDPPLVTSSASEQVFECGTPLFVPNPRANAVLREGPLEQEWNAFKVANEAAVASQSVVEVSIQGESARTITLTGIEMEADSSPRPDGAGFAYPCGDSVAGRFLSFDLDRKPPALVESSSDPEAEVGAVDGSGRSPFQPMTFPWEVSLTDPLLLNIVANTESNSVRWRAYITWRSGSESGRIAIDNGGEGFWVVGTAGLPSYSHLDGWQPY